MNNTSIRKQCADMIRYIRRNNKHQHINYNPIRNTAHAQDVFRFYINFLSLQDIVDETNRLNIPFKDVFFYTEIMEDHDGYDKTYLIGYADRKMTDEEYYDYLCYLILPTEYQMNEYKTYLMLKQKYEGEKE